MKRLTWKKPIDRTLKTRRTNHLRRLAPAARTFRGGRLMPYQGFPQLEKAVLGIFGIAGLLAFIHLAITHITTLRMLAQYSRYFQATGDTLESLALRKRLQAIWGHSFAGLYSLLLAWVGVVAYGLGVFVFRFWQEVVTSASGWLPWTFGVLGGLILTSGMVVVPWTLLQGGGHLLTELQKSCFPGCTLPIWLEQRRFRLFSSTDHPAGDTQ
jgi:hypothetical protein